MAKYVYSFGGNRNEGNASMRNTLGGKGCNLAEMAGLNIPVPPGFTVITDVCTLYNQAGKKLPAEVIEQVKEALGWLEELVGLDRQIARDNLVLQTEVILIRDQVAQAQARADSAAADL